MFCSHGIAGPCPICRSERRSDIAERELRETAEELERVRVQLAEVRKQRDTDAETCEEAVRSAEESLERLQEATGLLDTASDAIDEACYPVWWERYRAFLSGAPARDCSDPESPYAIMAAARDAEHARAESAEATLAAIREAVQDARREAKHYTASKWRAGVYEIALAAIEAALRTPAPSPSDDRDRHVIGHSGCSITAGRKEGT